MRRRAVAEYSNAGRVSIHAPLRGATAGLPELRRPQAVSIHAPLRGATRSTTARISEMPPFQSTHPCGVRPLLLKMSSQVVLFQSTHPCGVRLDKQGKLYRYDIVSIHAPLRGATLWLLRTRYYPLGFNPRTPAGCDMTWLTDDDGYISFNPRTPAGCDKWADTRVKRRMKFQSTHPCGVRRMCIIAFKPAGVFQSTHPCGVRQDKVPAPFGN